MQVANVEVEQKGEVLLLTFDLSGPEEDCLVSIDWAADGEYFIWPALHRYAELS